MQTGKCIFFSAEKGYGFLAPDNGSADIFVHFTSLDMPGYKKLDKGDEVSFDVELGPKDKPQAANVVVLRKAQVA
jgi:CspA family cold shock protein